MCAVFEKYDIARATLAMETQHDSIETAKTHVKCELKNAYSLKLIYFQEKSFQEFMRLSWMNKITQHGTQKPSYWPSSFQFRYF